MNNEDHIVRFAFRAIGISLRMVRKYQKIISGDEFDFGKWSQGRGQVMVIELTSEKVCLNLRSALKKFPLSCEIGIWVSIISEYDNDGLRMPLYISEFFREVGGHLDFNFIFIDSDDEKN